jgi:hypothetical protein
MSLCTSVLQMKLGYRLRCNRSNYMDIVVTLQVICILEWISPVAKHYVQRKVLNSKLEGYEVEIF